MSQQSAQGSITIKRLRSGDNLYIRFTTNGIPLFQAVNKDTGAVVPDWTQSANQPELTPVVSTLKGGTGAVTLQNVGWKYNYTDLTFNGATSGTWQTDSTGKFQMQQDTTAANYGAIRIIGNLASTTNYAADYLTFTAEAVVGGVEYQVEKVADILIQPAGGSSFVGTLTATSEQLSEQVTDTTLTARLYINSETGFVLAKKYHVKWWKDNQTDGTTTNATDGTPATKTVNRNQVDGTQLYIAEFFEGSDTGMTTCRFRQALRITDISDDYYVGIGITSQNKEVGASPVDIEASLYKVDKTSNTTTKVTTITGAWRMDIMRKGGSAGWSFHRSETATGTSMTARIDTSDTDWTDTTDGSFHQDDVEVIAEVTF